MAQFYARNIGNGSTAADTQHVNCWTHVPPQPICSLNKLVISCTCLYSLFSNNSQQVREPSSLFFRIMLVSVQKFRNLRFFIGFRLFGGFHLYFHHGTLLGDREFKKTGPGIIVDFESSSKLWRIFGKLLNPWITKARAVRIYGLCGHIGEKPDMTLWGWKNLIRPIVRVTMMR